MQPRVAILTNIPAPYRLAFFRRLSERCELRVIFDARSEPNREWIVPDDLGFPHTYVRGLTLGYRRKRRDNGLADQRYLQLRYGIIPELIRFRPDVVVSAELAVRSLQALAYSRLLGAPLILWSEGTPHTEGWVGRGKRVVRRLLVKRAARFWTNGVESSLLLESYGAKYERLDEGMIGVDTTALANRVQECLSARAAIREGLDAAGVTFLFSGQLIERKGVAQFLAALDGLTGRASEFTVLLLGDGEQRALVERWTRENPAAQVRLLGFRQPSEVAEIYAAADVFVLPTLDDNWSLVALEAAVAGLPQLFSGSNGAAADLLANGAPGELFDPKDIQAFTRALAGYLDRVPSRAADQSVERIASYYSPESCAERAWKSVSAALRDMAKMR